MSYLRAHWFDLGLVLALVVAIYLVFTRPSGVHLLLWISLITLFIHQGEEYRFPGYFPGMLNSSVFSSAQPDRYPLNAQTALIVNVFVGWLAYVLAALFAQHALWLGIATFLISLGNVVAHVLLFNLKGKTRYNPGMLTALLLFLPLTLVFFITLIQTHAASPLDWIIGILLGGALNYVGILKLIDWQKDTHTPYPFPARCMLPVRRQTVQMHANH